jgi:hypothetical protein
MEGALRVMFMLPSRPGALAGWAALVFVVLLLLLASVGTASAECAWVLWEYESTPRSAQWRILRTYDGRTECAADHAKLMSPNSSWHSAYEPLTEDSVIHKLPTGGVVVKRALCVPGTIDPREPKEK